jgi:hypothetical protein
MTSCFFLNRLVWLQICRAFAVLYLWCGFLKVVTVTRNYSEASAGRWLSSALAVFLACAQLCFGEVAWFLFLAILRRAMSDAPAFLDRGTFVLLFLFLFLFPKHLLGNSTDVVFFYYRKITKGGASGRFSPLFR